MTTAGAGDPQRSVVPRMSTFAALAAFVAAASAFLIVAPSAFASGTSGGACVAATSGTQVHFLTGLLAASPDGPAIAGLTVDGFDVGACDGLPVAVTITGNAAGSPAAPADELLTTLDSSLDPCTGAKLASPLSISGGSITMNACASVHDPNGAAYASIHEATQLTVRVADAVIPAVIGGAVTATPTPTAASTSPRSSIAQAGSVAASSHGVGGVSASRSSGGTGGHASGHHGLASTGVDIALLTCVGIALILFGVLLMRRRRTSHGHR